MFKTLLWTMLFCALAASAAGPNIVNDFAVDMWRQHFGENRYIEEGLKEAAKPTPKKKTVLFYFFSLSMPQSAWVNTFDLAKRLEGHADFYGVLRGMSMKVKKELSEARARHKDLEFKIKINPIMFKDLNITRVPAFVLAECDMSAGWLQHKRCRYEYEVLGDVSIDYALQKMAERSDEAKRLLKLYDPLESRKEAR